MTALLGPAAASSRRAVLAAGAATLLVSSVGRAQQARRTYRIGVISPTLRREPSLDAFFDELRRLGFIDGANLLVDGRFEVGTEDLDAVATDVVKQAPDAIVCIGTVVVRAGQRATATIPIVAGGYDLLGSKLVSSLAHPEGNTTGVSIVATELDGKRQEILMELVPGARHMAALADPNSPYQLQALREAAHARGVELSVHWIAKPDEIGPGIEAAGKEGAQALNVLASPMLFANRKVIFSATAQARLPAIYQWPDMSEDGGLIAYGPPQLLIFRRFARLLVKVLNGAKPSDVPVEQPTTFELVINLKTAKALGITIPTTLLSRADKVIE